MPDPSGSRLAAASLPLFLVLVGSACRPGEDPVVEAWVDEEVANVIHLEWTTAEPGVSYVEYGTTQDYGMITPTTSRANTNHALELYGLPALSDVYYRVVTETDQGTVEATGVTGTNSLPSSIPDLDLTAADDDRLSPEKYVLLVTMGSPGSLLVLDREGNRVWYHELTSVTDDSPLFYSDVFFAEDGNDILYNVYSLDSDDGRSEIRRVSLSGDQESAVETAQGHHAFTEKPDGTIAYLAADMRSWQMGTMGEPVDIVGDAIVEVDSDGDSRTVFSTWDWSDPILTENWDTGYYTEGADWTHGNNLEYRASTDSYLLSLGFVELVLEIDAQTGEVLHEFGAYGENPVSRDSTPFYFQHDANWTPDDHLMVFSASEDDTYSTALEYEFDEDSGELVEVWSSGSQDDLHSYAEGQARRLENGNTLVNYSTTGILQEVTPEGDVVWEVQADLGSTILGATFFEDFYAGE